jgi:Peptidase M1 N-terminal domain
MKFSSSAISLFLWSASQQTPPSVAFAASSSGLATGKRAVSSLAALASPSRRQQQQQQCGWNDGSHSQSCSLISGSRNNYNMLFGSSFRGGGGGGTSSPLSTISGSSNSALKSTLVENSDTITKPIEIFRKNYQPLPFTVSTVQLSFDIYDGKTFVTSTLTLAENLNSGPTVSKDELVLDGDEESIKLLSIAVDGHELTEGIHYELLPGKLVLKNPKNGSVITTKVEIVPENNTQLAGLYKSSSTYCTQCEAMGFRRITYYPDRPDNMAVFEKVRIEASKENYPVLLSNGNLIEEGEASDSSRHYAVWSDPFPKPSYLFATVAGNLGKIEDTFTTSSGRNVKLVLYSEHKNVDKLHYAMDALKRSMKWDEDRFGVSSSSNRAGVFQF